ncbi:MAG: 16S rRNA (cytidine(1402)-2'-O)-methyltransferase [Lachnospiraceae bacterium]|jgi:16S rRNA (cytidine1402-2'-O)-methyltransferase|nr:16S rRNA (cytidine(1402)-2'-O)-methyltransferase [Lachnospiraceae bacterium]
MAGMLYLCATPIGNLEDITVRVLRVLKEVDLIAAEDTRNSIKLLNHFEIHTPMTSYHEFNKYDKAKVLVEKMLTGMDVALITDAGTPGISDPGEELVRQAYDAGLSVTSLPGAAACVTALTLSGLSTRRFAFEAFLPTEKKERAAILESLKRESRTIVLYEAPHRLVRTLEELADVLGNRAVSVCKELTKRHETVRRFHLEEAAAYYQEQEPKGEYVLVIEGKSLEEQREECQAEKRKLPLTEQMEQYLAQGFSKKEAMKAVAAERGISRRDVYQMLLELESQEDLGKQ